MINKSEWDVRKHGEFIKDSKSSEKSIGGRMHRRSSQYYNIENVGYDSKATNDTCQVPMNRGIPLVKSLDECGHLACRMFCGIM